MKSIYNFCEKLSASTNLTSEQQEIIVFGAESIFSTLYSMGLTLLLSWALGVVQIMLMVFVPFAIMKTFAGGTHCKTMTNCAIFSALSFSGSAKLVNLYPAVFKTYEQYVLVLVLFVSLLFYYLWSPAQVDEKPISREYGRKLRAKTFISLTLIFLILEMAHLLNHQYAYPLVSAGCVGILMQSLGVTPLGYKLMDVIDSVLTRILKGGGER